ncbi:meiosis-specific protein ASY3 [Lotus japonicus]|uniref:meiosis-specific protein ASY3 n=1 Tax=Lotus japonicus TaxID=34305 RepID=UPI00258B5FE0|nr:meiosis-specific protein ASY3 [Lotus japonicus]XP_057422766.1 meiosis-specific protein ASY3 [Lotus japonicus]
MDSAARQILRDERTSDCRSFGSNVHQSSQSRKISIGIMVDSNARARCGAKGDGAVVSNPERVTSNVGNFVGEKSKVEGMTASANIKEIGGAKGVEHSWVSKSFYQKTPTSETILQANETSNLLVSHGGRDKPDGIKCAAEKQSVQFFSYQTSNFPSDNYKKFDGESSKRKGRNDETPEERVEEFTFTTAPGVVESDKTKAEDKVNRTDNSTENLRMKLCQILGTTSSPKTQDSGSHTRKMDEESSPIKLRVYQKEHKFAKNIQNSDPIETDSENSGQTRERPVTRSRTRKKASSQKLPGKGKTGPSSKGAAKPLSGKGKTGPSSKGAEKRRDKTIFSFEEKWIGGQDAFPNDSSSLSLKKKGHGKNSRIGRKNIGLAENYAPDKLHQDTSKTDLPLNDEAPFSLGKKVEGFTSFLSDYQKKVPQAQKINQEKEFYKPPTVNNTNQHGELEVSENEKQQECRSSPIKQNVAKSQDEFQSPTFQFKTSILSSSPSSTPKTNKKANDASSPASTDKRFSLGSIRNLRTFQALEPDFNGLREPKLSSDMEELKNSSPRKEKYYEKEEKEQDGLSDSSSEEMNFKGSHHQGSRVRRSAERKSFTLHPIKRLRKHEGIKFNDTSPASSKGTGASDWIDGASEQNQDGFVRAVELFALELGKLKSKLKLMTNQKSSEILKSVAEEIHLQLQDVHSQIQTDIGKLTNIGKSKRKRLETRFEDQQKQLRSIYDRFKEEVTLHLQDCRSTVEDLEADQIEIKGTLEKQRVAHKKLLSKVEEAVDIQLNDAQRKITATQEMARGKLLQLKQVITMCLKEGIIN